MREDTFRKLVASGWTQSSVARKYGVSRQYVHTVIKGRDPSKYRAQRTYRRMKASGRCAHCGTTERLEIHHKDRNPRNDLIENLQVLCHSCHRDEHHISPLEVDRTIRELIKDMVNKDCFAYHAAVRKRLGVNASDWDY